MLHISPTVMHVLCLNIFGKSVGEASPEYRSVTIESIVRSQDSVQVKGFICRQDCEDKSKLVTVAFDIEM